MRRTYVCNCEIDDEPVEEPLPLPVYNYGKDAQRDDVQRPVENDESSWDGEGEEPLGLPTYDYGKR